MGQIAPRRRRMRAKQMVSRLQTWLAARRLQQTAGEEETRMASDTSSRLPTWLQRIWHFTDHIRWMDPLPAPHRRGIPPADMASAYLAFYRPYSLDGSAACAAPSWHSGGTAGDAGGVSLAHQYPALSGRAVFAFCGERGADAGGYL